MYALVDRFSISSDNGLVPSHYLNQCWVIVNWTLMNKLQLNFHPNTNLFIHENASENIVCQNGCHFVQRGDELKIPGHTRAKHAICLILPQRCQQIMIIFPWCESTAQISLKNYVITQQGLESFHKLAFWHDDVIKWKHFPRNWPFVRGIHRSRWIPHTKASDAEHWCFLWSAAE